MNFKKIALVALAFTATIALGPLKAYAATECGTSDKITIAEMTWLSASSLAHISKQILAEGYGCTVELIPGDTVPTATTMLTRSSPDIAPELWVNVVETVWEKIQKKGNILKANDIFADGGKEGWWIPDYTAKENPSLKSVSDLENHAKLFAEPANPEQGRLYGCPPGWGCEIITNNLFKALKLESSFELFSPGSGANLKASIARRVTQRKPLVAYYWGPTAVIGKYNLVKLGMPAYNSENFKCLTDKNCKDPKASGWKTSEVIVAVTTKLRDKAPNVAGFLGKLQVPNKVINKVLAWGDDNSASPAEVATHFLKTEEAVWTKWVPADVAGRVKASL